MTDLSKRQGLLYRIGLALALVLGLYFVVGWFTTTNSRGDEPVRANIERLMTSSPAGKVVKERFPDEFAAMVDRNVTNELDPNLTRAQKDRLIEQANRDMRDRNGDHAYYAPPEVLLKVLQHLRDDTNLVLDEYGAATCARYLNEGTDVLPRLSDKVKTSNATIGEMNILAIAEGRDHPTSRSDITEDDLTELQAAVAAFGVDLDELQDTALGRPTDNACINTLAVIQVAINLPGDVGDRVRANLVWTMAKA